MAGDKTKRQVSPQPHGDKLRYPKGKYQTPSYFEVRGKELNEKGESIDVIKRIEHFPDVYPEMRGTPATIHVI